MLNIQQTVGISTNTEGNCEMSNRLYIGESEEKKILNFIVLLLFPPLNITER